MRRAALYGDSASRMLHRQNRTIGISALQFSQFIFMETDESARGNIGIGWNSTTAMSGHLGSAYGDEGDHSAGGVPSSPSLGINVVTALENAAIPPART